MRATLHPLADQSRYLVELSHICPAPRPAARGHRRRQAVRCEHQTSMIPNGFAECRERSAGVFGERLEEAGMVEIGTELVDPRRSVPRLLASTLDVVEVLQATGVRAVRRGDEGDGAARREIGRASCRERV